MIKERLKDIDLKITELSDYMQISRPTMYKFIEAYDDGNSSRINKHVLKLFKYIDENPLIGKKTVVSYILTNLVEEKELGDTAENRIYNQIKRYLISNPESVKSQFIELVVQKTDYDDAIKLYETFNQKLNESVKTYPGVFGADMLINIQNDGPITIVIDSKNK